MKRSGRTKDASTQKILKNELRRYPLGKAKWLYGLSQRMKVGAFPERVADLHPESAKGVLAFPSIGCVITRFRLPR